ncbi:AAA family ATPase [Nonomuraea sp. NPDC048901]|uniref:AAA family ATPase n=1 Tax=Nonomuraea sp. NPDC048901 TaxID=3155627 RepID=UPI0034001399
MELLKRDLKKAEGPAKNVAKKEDVEADPVSAVPDDVALTDAQEAWKQAQELADLYRKARDKYHNANSELERRERELEKEANRVAEQESTLRADALGIKAERQSLADSRRELEEEGRRQLQAGRESAERRAHLDRRERELNQRAYEIETARIDAEAGFLEQERVALHRLAEQREKLLEDIEHDREHFREEFRQRSKKLNEELKQDRDELRQAQERARTELDRERAELAAQEGRLRIWERRLQAADEIQEEDREHLHQQAELAVAARLEKLELLLRQRTVQYETAVEHARSLEVQVEQHNEELRRAGHEAPEALSRRVQQLTTDNAALQQRLSALPSRLDVEELDRLKAEHGQCQVMKGRLELENARLRNDLSSYTIAVTELEQLREHRDMLQHSVKVHKQLLADARSDLDDALSSAEAASPFPGMKELDETAALQTPAPVENRPPKLEELVGYIQQRILADRKHRRGETPLAYSGRDIRCLLAGLATTRLHILQGMSGIGKTTFPKAFAQAIGADYEVIEVQAGWRDRQDLIGHLNAFERRYYETRFTKAIYRAGCAAHLQRPFFVILDEMNLAHPEQYFADILSGLENEGTPLRLQLTSHPVTPLADLLIIERGVQLPVPDNVWFFGTANHDETTVQFADKTYDRSHIIELPVAPPDLEIAECPARAPLSRKALMKGFAEAWTAQRADQNLVVTFFRENFAQVLADFKLSWGPRLDQQIRDFAPIVVAAGGSYGEAADHILATRILRKLRGRYNLRPEKLQELRELADERWPKLDKSRAGEPIATRALLDELMTQE